MKKIIMENNIDRLEIAYKLDEDVIKTILEKSNVDGVVHYDDFLLIRTKTINEFEFNYDIVCDTLPNTNGEAHKFVWGKLQWGSHRKRHIYINVSNRTFYNNTLSFIYFIADTIGLSFYKITKLDLAIDCNVNLVKKFYKMLRDENYTPIIFHKEFPNMNEKIPHLLNMGNGTRLRPYMNKSFDIRKVSNFKSLSLHCYNKLDEVKENNYEKQYILDKVNIKPMYRMEIRSKSIELDYTLGKMGLSHYDLYMQLLNDVILIEFYYRLMDRIIRIKKNDNIIPLLTLLINM